MSEIDVLDELVVHAANLNPKESPKLPHNENSQADTQKSPFPYKIHRYEDRYWDPDLPPGMRHPDNPIAPHIQTHENHEHDVFYSLIKPEEIPMDITRLDLQELAFYYDSIIKSPAALPGPEEIALLAAKLFAVAKQYELKSDDPDDHDFGKDCEQYCERYRSLLNSKNELTYRDIVELTRAIEVIIHGCHTEVFPADLFIDADSNEIQNLLECKFHWNPEKNSNLWEYYEKYWKGKSAEERTIYNR